jgi:hypothetical protein
MTLSGEHLESPRTGKMDSGGRRVADTTRHGGAARRHHPRHQAAAGAGAVHAGGAKRVLWPDPHGAPQVSLRCPGAGRHRCDLLPRRRRVHPPCGPRCRGAGRHRCELTPHRWEKTAAGRNWGSAGFPTPECPVAPAPGAGR